jgi:solute:Na+ symporter, SSS family
MFSYSFIHSFDYHLVEDSSKITMVMAFSPLVLGMFWKGSNTTGAIASIIFGTTTWISLEVYNRSYGSEAMFAPELAGFIMAFTSMIIFSLLFKEKIKEGK